MGYPRSVGLNLQVVVVVRSLIPRDHRYTGCLHALARLGFIAHAANRFGRRTDEDKPGVLDGGGEIGILG